jgi:hypothetical protein
MIDADSRRLDELINRFLNANGLRVGDTHFPVAFDVLAMFLGGDECVNATLFAGLRTKGIESGSLDPMVALIAAVVVGVAALLDSHERDDHGSRLDRYFRLCQLMYSLRDGLNPGTALVNRRAAQRKAAWSAIDAAILAAEDGKSSGTDIATKIRPLLPPSARYGVRRIATRVRELRDQRRESATKAVTKHPT